MKKYYGLRLIRTFFFVLSIVVSIVTVASMGTFFAVTTLNHVPFDAIRALTVLISGGLIALLSYAFAQLIDLQLSNFSAAGQVHKQMKEMNEQNAILIDLVQEQIQLARLQGNISPNTNFEEIQRQLEERRRKLS